MKWSNDFRPLVFVIDFSSDADDTFLQLLFLLRPESIVNFISKFRFDKTENPLSLKNEEKEITRVLCFPAIIMFLFCKLSLC